MHWAGFWLIYIFPCLTVVGFLLGGVAVWTSPVVAFLLIPIMDLLIGTEKKNLPTHKEQSYLQKKRYDYALYGFVPVQFGMVLWSAYWITHHNLSLSETFALCLSMGVIHGGLSINVAHELCHRNSQPAQTLAKMLWLSVCYSHFHIEHRLGHHLKVGTPEDPATAKLGESIYHFYPRSIIGGYKSAWRLESKRLQRLKTNRWSLQNQMLVYLLLTLGVGVLLGSLWGFKASYYFYLQGCISILILETVNYLEHYGLQRNKHNGSYEPVGINHSWNASQKLTNYLLLNLQRHADHHAYSGRRYPVLRHFEESPQLPTGYGGMMMVSLIPPLWFWMMNPRVEKYNHGKYNYEES